MTGVIFGVIVVVFAVVAVVLIRRTQKGAFVAQLPLEDGEKVILEEEGLRVAHRSRQLSASGGMTTTLRVRSRLTDRRIVLATGGPEGKHKFTLLAILDYTTPADPVPETGLAAYKRKFRLANGYPTYSFTPEDMKLEDGGGVFRVDVPFPERGSHWGPPPEVRIFSGQADRYRAAVLESEEPRGGGALP